MGIYESKLATMAGLLLVKWLVKSDEDTTELEAKIAAAKSKEAIEDIAKEAAIEYIKDKADIGLEDEADAVIDDLIDADSSEKVKEVLVKPGILESIFGAIAGLIGAIFGKK